MVGVVMFLASVVPYGLAEMAGANPAAEAVGVTAAVDAASPSVNVASAPSVFSAGTVELDEMLGSFSDPTMMLASGVALLGLAAGVRRHTC